MRILIVHHGNLSPKQTPICGGALRARQIGFALQQAGYETIFLCRSQDQIGGYCDKGDLLHRVRELAPDRIICIQMEEAPILGQLNIPLVVDLFALRLLEAPFAGDLAQASVHCLQAIAAGDIFLVSNPRQKWAWLGVLALAGVDTRTDPTLLVPLSATPQKRKGGSKDLTLVGGGVWWPWQNPWPFLQRALTQLDKRKTGKIIWYGQGSKAAPIQHPRLELPGWLDHDGFRNQLSQASAAFDWLQPNPERELAMAFRHMDYLGCGLGILTFPNSPLADVLGEAGWIGEEIEQIIDHLIDNPKEWKKKSQAAHILAEKFSAQKTVQPLIDWLPKAMKSTPKRSPLLHITQEIREATQAKEEYKRCQISIQNQEAEIKEKRKEVTQLQLQIQQLMTTIDRLSRAMDEVAGFKREAIQVLGQRIDYHSLSAEEIRRENAILRADLEKKTAELHAMDQLRERLENDVQNLREQLESRKGSLFGWREKR